jgi:drug/metabolite transporter (DMT)-like permease
MPSSASTLVAYVALALTWGSSFLLMKVALNEFSPSQVAVGRILVGAVTLTTLMIATRRTWPRERWLWGHMAVVSVFLCVIPFLLFAWAETYLPSGVGAILNSTTPIWTAVAMTILVRGTRLRRGQILGIVLGAGGVLMIMGVWQVVTAPAFLGSLPAQAACLGATASYGLAFAWMTRFVNGRHVYDSITIASVQLANAAAVSLTLAPLIATTRIVVEPVPTLALLTLGVLGTGVAYVWNTRVIIAWGSLAASTVTYLIPLVGVVLGILILRERLSWHEPLGALVVIVSVMLVQKRRLSTTWVRRTLGRRAGTHVIPRDRATTSPPAN